MNKEIKLRLKHALEEYLSCSDRNLLDEIKAMLPHIHDELIDSIIIDGYYVESKPQPFRDKINTINKISFIDFCYNLEYDNDKSNWGKIYVCYDADDNLVCSIHEKFLDDSEAFHDIMLKRTIGLLRSDLEIAEDTETSLREEIADIIEDLRIKERNLLMFQQNIIMIKNTISNLEKII